LNHNAGKISSELKKLSSPLDLISPEISIILAAGHGKRIKSEKSKILHEIWGRPSVWRVSEVARKGLSSTNQIIVVGKKALEVARALGKKEKRVFVYQNEQKGTGDAVRIALEYEELRPFHGDVYVFPGDMGLFSEHTVVHLKKNFKSCNCDMLVLTGYFEGNIEDNYYGRIIKSRREEDTVIEIKEHRDILAMDVHQEYTVVFKGKKETFAPEELLQIREFNVGVYSFKIDPLRDFISHLQTNNVQGEIYVTDLIKIYNDNGLKVCSSRVKNNNLVVSFNVKSVLKKMDATFRDLIYEKLKDIITIDDPDDFFIAEETVERIIAMDKKYPALDIKIGKGAYIGENIEPNRGLSVGRNAILKGHVRIGENVTIGENANLSTYPGQTITIGDNSAIYRGNYIQGSVKIGKGVRVETGVKITGSSEEPVIIGDNVLIKGTTYIFGSTIENSILIEHSILKRMYVEKVLRKNGEIQPVKYILPHPEGLDSLSKIGQSER